MQVRVAALFRYPLKSGAGELCKTLTFERIGVKDDRRWIVVSPAGVPITQRESPAMAFIQSQTDDSGLTLSWKSSDRIGLRIPQPESNATRLVVTIWGDRVTLPLANDAAAAWVSDQLGRDARLAFMPEDVERPVNPNYARPGDRTALTDGFPVHLIGSGSLVDLNSRLAEPVGIERFRPNILVDCTAPFAEDGWENVRIGDCRFRVVKPCPRCSVTTVDPDTGERGDEPLRTLAGYRKREGGVMFGQNLIHEGTGEIHVGDLLEVISRRDAPEA